MNEEVKALKSELALLKLQFSERVTAVESRLDSLLVQEQTSTKVQQQDITVIEEYLTPVMPAESSDTTVITAEEYLATRAELDVLTLATPSFITVFFQTLLSSLFEWLSPVTKIYQSYKERGMLGIFILTMVGISLTLAGFGYLMQLLIDQLGAGSKSLLICIAALGVMGLGIHLKIKTRFGEFATAIVTLGILLSYSAVYFSGSVYGLLPDLLVFILYLVIALLCHALALWLDTKVVAALGIIGIATMPMLSNTMSLDPFYYLLSLAFVVCSSLILAYRHLGAWLVHLSLAFTLISLEWLIGFEETQISSWLVNLFYLLFFVYVAISLFKDKVPTNKTLVFLATLVGSTVVIFLQVTDIFTVQMSINFTLNSLIAIGASVFFYRVKRELTYVFILLAASWAVLSIVSVIGDAYWGIAWAVEGILLIAIARRYKISAVIHQGQTLTAIALLYCWSALAMYFPLPALTSIDGWLLSIMIVVIIATWQRLINNNEVYDDFSKNRVKPFLQLLEVVWLSILLITSADIWLGNWTGTLVILVQIALLFRAKNCKQVTIEIFAAILLIVPLFYAYQGAILVDSYRFTMLPLFAKVAVFSVFIQLWLWSAFYRKYQPSSLVRHFAESARILFYLLIPVCWLGSVIRRFDDNSLMLLWLSPLIALFLARKVNHHLLFKETKVLTGLASFAFAIGVGQLTLINSIVVLLGFLSFFAAAYFFNRQNSASIYKFICSWGILSLGFAIPNIIGFQTHNMMYGLLIAAIFWGAAFNAINLSEHLKRNETFIIVINLLLVIVAWLFNSSNVSYALLPIIFLIAALYQKEQKFKHSRLGEILKQNGDLFLHSIVAITYVVLCSALIKYQLDLLIAPALAIHGALILFSKDRRITTVKYSFGLILLGITKLAMIDAANALLWQKVILFMGIGVFILVASFWYQKFVSRVAVT
ncbi:MAG: DUF2339 domain-containing protein [Colwellia sp.]|nr:DUF2339 domain-containing protein [Colwellia sp.]